MRRTTIRLVAAVLLGLGAQPRVWADVLTLANKQTIEGLVVQEDGAHIKVQIAWQSYVTVDRQTVVSMSRGDAREHEQLLARWHEEFQADQQRERAQRDLDAAQRARGLVKYRGEWIKPEELLEIQARKQVQQARQERQKFEEQLNQLAQQVRALSEENQRLRQELFFARQQVVVLPQPVLVRHQPADPTLFTDEQGNRIRVQEHDSHKFFTTTDGKHVDLQTHDGHLAFTDEQGLHHDLRGPR